MPDYAKGSTREGPAPFPPRHGNYPLFPLAEPANKPHVYRNIPNADDTVSFTLWSYPVFKSRFTGLWVYKTSLITFCIDVAGPIGPYVSPAIEFFFFFRFLHGQSQSRYHGFAANTHIFFVSKNTIDCLTGYCRHTDVDKRSSDDRIRTSLLILLPRRVNVNRFVNLFERAGKKVTLYLKEGVRISTGGWAWQAD